MQELTLTLTVEDVNAVLEGLGNLPFAKVYALVAKIQTQASGQLRPRTNGDEPPASTDGGGKSAP